MKIIAWVKCVDQDGVEFWSTKIRYNNQNAFIHIDEYTNKTYRFHIQTWVDPVYERFNGIRFKNLKNAQKALEKFLHENNLI